MREATHFLLCFRRADREDAKECRCRIGEFLSVGPTFSLGHNQGRIIRSERGVQG